MAGRDAGLRLDKWLWHARLCKTRSQAARLVAGGAVRVNTERVVKPAAVVQVGDGLTVVLGQRVRALRVTGLGLRRGPATEARELYLDLDAPAAAEQDPGGLEPGGQADT